MSQAIIRLYGSAANATAAVKQLRYEGFAESAITVLAPGDGAGTDAIVKALTAGWVLKEKAGMYAAEVQAGHWLVSVLAPFGMGGLAEEALDRYSPVASRVPSEHARLPQWDEAAPISSALGIPPLWRGAAPDSSLGIPTATDPKWSLSSALGLPLLSKSSVSSRLSPELSHLYLSAKLGLPLLTKSAGAKR